MLDPEDPSSENKPQYVLAGQPTGWSAVAKAVRDFDEERVRDCKEDIDTLLVFAGLFSAVLSAFLLVAYTSLQPSSEDRMIALLDRLVTQTSSYSLQSGYLNTTALPAPILPPFEPSRTDIAINALWFASLIISLMTASFGMLVKQWLREFMAVEKPSPQARLRSRYFREPHMKTWKVFEIAAILPLLLQLALGLFFTGLCYFSTSIHSTIKCTTLPLVIGWAFCFFGATFMPLFFPRCAYKTTLLKGVIRELYQSLHRFMASHFPPKPSSIRIHQPRQSYLFTLVQRFIAYVASSDEAKAVISDAQDMRILADADAIQSDDEMLRTAIAEAVVQARPSSGKVIELAHRLLVNRAVLEPVKSMRDWKPVVFEVSDESSEFGQAIVSILRTALFESKSPLIGFEDLPLAKAQANLTAMTLSLLASRYPHTTRHTELLSQLFCRLGCEEFAWDSLIENTEKISNPPLIGYMRILSGLLNAAHCSGPGQDLATWLIYFQRVVRVKKYVKAHEPACCTCAETRHDTYGTGRWPCPFHTWSAAKRIGGLDDPQTSIIGRSLFSRRTSWILLATQYLRTIARYAVIKFNEDDTPSQISAGTLIYVTELAIWAELDNYYDMPMVILRSGNPALGLEDEWRYRLATKPMAKLLVSALTNIDLHGTEQTYIIRSLCFACAKAEASNIRSMSQNLLDGLISSAKDIKSVSPWKTMRLSYLALRIMTRGLFDEQLDQVLELFDTISSQMQKPARKISEVEEVKFEALRSDCLTMMDDPPAFFRTEYTRPGNDLLGARPTKFRFTRAHIDAVKQLGTLEHLKTGPETASPDKTVVVRVNGRDQESGVRVMAETSTHKASNDGVADSKARDALSDGGGGKENDTTSVSGPVLAVQVIPSSGDGKPEGGLEGKQDPAEPHA